MNTVPSRVSKHKAAIKAKEVPKPLPEHQLSTPEEEEEDLEEINKQSLISAKPESEPISIKDDTIA